MSGTDATWNSELGTRNSRDSGPVMLVGGEPFTQPFDRFHLRWLREVAVGSEETVSPPTADRRPPTIVFLATAAEIFPNDETVDAAYRLGRMGRVLTLPARTRIEADDADSAAAIMAADVVYLGDGDSGRLVRTLVGTAAGDAIIAAWRGGATLIAAGAGAAGLCAVVPARPDDVPARVGEPFFRIFPGFGLLPGIVVLPRYNRTPAVWLRRLKQSLADSRQPLAVGKSSSLLTAHGYPLTAIMGVDDVTALVWRGAAWTVEGYGRVTLADADGERSYGTGETVPLPIPE